MFLLIFCQNVKKINALKGFVFFEAVFIFKNKISFFKDIVIRSFGLILFYQFYILLLQIKKMNYERF
mgnify:CR=1 FL=1